MSSLLSRIRSRAIGQSTAKSSNVSEPATPTLSPALSPASATLLTPPTAYDFSPEIDRKILADVSGLFNLHSEDGSPSMQGLRLPRSRRSTLTKILNHEAENISSLSSLREARARRDFPTPSCNEISVDDTGIPQQAPSPYNKAESRLSGEIVGGSPWSTFGRYTKQLTPPPPKSRTSSRRVRRDTSRRSISSLRPSEHRSSKSAPSAHDSVSSQHSDTKEQGQSSPQRTVSSQVDSEHSVKTQSNSDHSVPSAQIHSFYATPATRSVAYDSPHTFGHPSPSPSRVRSHDHRTPPSPPPPLPPLNHPELVLSLSSRSRSKTLLNPHDSSLHPRTWNAYIHAQTFPPRRLRRKTEGDLRKTSQSSRSTLARSIKPSPSLPSVQRIFQQYPEDMPLRSRRSSGSRPRSASGFITRRSSADWNAQQASAGVISSSPSQYGWPAEVSREILKLSLGEDVLVKLGGAGQRSVEWPAKAAQRGGNVPAGLICDSLSRGGAPCFHSSLIPSSPPPSAALQSPILLRDTARDGSSNLSSPSSSDTHGQIEAENSGKGDCRMVENDAPIDTLNGSANGSIQAKINLKTKTRNDRHRHRPSRRSILKPVSFPSPIPEAGSSTLSTSAFPSTEPDGSNGEILPREHRRSASEPALQSVLQTPVNSKKGKRKAEEVDGSPPDPKNGQHTTFLIPPESRRPHLSSELSHAPSSYRRKRVRLSDVTNSPTSSPGHSRPSTSQNASFTSSPGSWPSRAGAQLSRAASKTASTWSGPRQNVESGAATIDRRRSMSEVSFPISALVAPHAPSISRSSTYHMRDPRRPPRVTRTEWGLRLRGEDEEGSPVHAWLFFIGFILFPLWWVASFTPIPRTRRVGGTDTEKAVMLDDPQVEHDARTWRIRCRVMSGVSLVTYIPFIVLIAIFAPR